MKDHIDGLIQDFGTSSVFSNWVTTVCVKVLICFMLLSLITNLSTDCGFSVCSYISCFMYTIRIIWFLVICHITLFLRQDYQMSSLNSNNRIFCTKWWVSQRVRGVMISQDQLGRISQIANFIGPTWGPPGSCWPQMGPIMAPWSLLSG